MDIEDILQRAMPSRGEFTDSEREVADAVVKMLTSGEHRHSGLPTRFVGLGDRIRIAGVEYLCIPRPRITCPAAACEGCDLSHSGRHCYDVQCGRFDRRDGLNVWYQEVVDD